MGEKIKWLLLGCFNFIAITIFCQSDKSGTLLEKGNMYVGLTFSFVVSKTENEQQVFTLIQDRTRNEFVININSGYFIRKNWALGAQLSYGRMKRIGTEIDVFNVPEDISMIEESWGIYGSTKNYLSLGNSNRF